MDLFADGCALGGVDVFFAKKNGTQIVQSAKVPMAVHCMAF